MGKDSQSTDKLPRPQKSKLSVNQYPSSRDPKIMKLGSNMNSTSIVVDHINNLPTINLNNRISKAHDLYQKNLKLFDAIQKTKSTIPKKQYLMQLDEKN